MTIETLEVAKPGAHEVLLNTAYAGLCHSDLHFLEGLYPIQTPVVLGHKSSAVVEAVGSEVNYVKPGDRVITCLSVFCGTCEYCTTGRPNLCSNAEVKMPPGKAQRLFWNGRTVGQFANLSSFAEQLLVHENAVVKIADDIPLNVAALVGCGVITGAGAVINTAKVPAGSTVAVFGCGGIGLSAVNGAAIAGADRIIAIDTISSKLDVAKQMGATDVINASNVDPVEAIKDMTGGGVEFSFEAVGLKRTAEQCFEVAPPRRNRHDHRHGAVRDEDRAARLRLPARAADPGLVDGQQPVPCRHAEAPECLEEGASETRPPDLQPHQAGRDQRGLREAQERRRAASIDRFRRGEIARLPSAY